MSRFTPYEKLSKKRRRALDNERRGTWGAINPVTKRPERSDAYKRHKEKANIAQQARRWQDTHSDGLSFLNLKIFGFGGIGSPIHPSSLTTG